MGKSVREMSESERREHMRRLAAKRWEGTDTARRRISALDVDLRRKKIGVGLVMAQIRYAFLGHVGGVERATVPEAVTCDQIARVHCLLDEVDRMIFEGLEEWKTQPEKVPLVDLLVARQSLDTSLDRKLKLIGLKERKRPALTAADLAAQSSGAPPPPPASIPEGGVGGGGLEPTGDTPESKTFPPAPPAIACQESQEQGKAAFFEVGGTSGPSGEPVERGEANGLVPDEGEEQQQTLGDA